MEVSDSSRDYDVEIKTPLYAAANVPEYWMLDLTENRVVRHVAPSGGRYVSVHHHAPSEAIAPDLLPHCRVRIADLLGL
jgi:Uma2 family endonuclease